MKQCKECINYVKHFYIDYNFNLTALNCGHCMLENNMRAKSCINFQKSNILNNNTFALGNELLKLSEYITKAETSIQYLVDLIQKLSK